MWNIQVLLLLPGCFSLSEEIESHKSKVVFKTAPGTAHFSHQENEVKLFMEIARDYYIV